MSPWAEVVQGIVNTPRLARDCSPLSPPGSGVGINDEVLTLWVETMPFHRLLELKHLSHPGLTRNILSKAWASGPQIIWGAVLLPSGLMVRVRRTISSWLRVGLPLRAMLVWFFKDLPYFIVADLGVDPFCFTFYIAILSGWCCRKKPLMEFLQERMLNIHTLSRKSSCYPM